MQRRWPRRMRGRGTIQTRPRHSALPTFAHLDDEHLDVRPHRDEAVPTVWKLISLASGVADLIDPSCPCVDSSLIGQDTFPLRAAVGGAGDRAMIFWCCRCPARPLHNTWSCLTPPTSWCGPGLSRTHPMIFATAPAVYSGFPSPHTASVELTLHTTANEMLRGASLYKVRKSLLPCLVVHEGTFCLTTISPYYEDKPTLEAVSAHGCFGARRLRGYRTRLHITIN